MPSRSELIEEAAKAAHDWNYHSLKWDLRNELEKEAWRDDASVVIDALRRRWPHIADPGRVETVEELDALPVGSVILLGPDEPAVKRFHDEWVVACSPIECTTEEIGGAFIGGHSYPVLFRPDTTNPEEGTR